MSDHEEKNSGWGKRDQDFGDPHRDPALDGPNNVPDSMTHKPGLDRSAVPGAHGDQAVEPDIKPGTKLDIEKNT